MAVFDYHDLLAHVGHSFECVMYGEKQNVALACNDCHEGRTNRPQRRAD